MAVAHFSPQFQISARAETSHVIATKFQPGGRAEISARAETRHVIGPLVLVPAPRVFDGLYGFSPSTKTNISKFQFDLESVDEKQLHGYATANSHLLLLIKIFFQCIIFNL